MKLRSSNIALLVLGALACSSRDAPPPPPPPRCEPPPTMEEPPLDAADACAPRAPDEWAAAPAGAPFLLPYHLALSPEGSFAEAVFVAGPPTARRYTYRLDLEDATVMPMAVETLDDEWTEAWRAGVEREGLDRYLVCERLPAGGELRLLPARPGGTPVAGRFYGHAYGGAIRQRDAHGRQIAAHPVWVPEPTDEGRRCGERLLLWPDGRIDLLCLVADPYDRHCPFDCLGNVDRDNPWLCTGRTPSELPFCQPR